MIKFIVASTMAVFALAAQAQVVNFQTGSSLTGGNTRLGKMAAESMQQHGVQVEFKATGNCALTKKAWQQAKGPFMAIWSSTFNQPDSACRVDFKLSEIVAVLYEFPMALCSLQEQNLADYKRPGSRHLIGVPGNKFDYRLFKFIEDNHDIKHSFVNYRNVAETQAGAKSGEIQWVFASQASAERMGARCLWSTGRSGTGPLPAAKDLWKAAPGSVNYYTVWIAGKNLDTALTKKIHTSLQAATSSQEWIEFALSRGYLGFSLDLETIDTATASMR
jgi:hypothetical protein